MCISEKSESNSATKVGPADKKGCIKHCATPFSNHGQLSISLTAMSRPSLSIKCPSRMLRFSPSLYLQVQGHISADPTAQLDLGNIFLQNVKTQFLTKKQLELFNTNSTLMSTFSSQKKKKV